jgi:hypothetical protein
VGIAGMPVHYVVKEQGRCRLAGILRNGSSVP